MGYESLHAICFTYGKYGHKANGCTTGSDRALVIVNPNSVAATGVNQKFLAKVDTKFGDKLPTDQNEVEITPDKAATNTKELDFGPWMIVNCI